ncbi:hypothetical protein KAR91_53975 [Candidatus Pacearchaeota archaeon]|nr:hypothetical protein [Candidatus Pacearchaeota archaeon]
MKFNEDDRVTMSTFEGLVEGTVVDVLIDSEKFVKVKFDGNCTPFPVRIIELNHI